MMIRYTTLTTLENYRSEVSILGSDGTSVGNWSQFKTTTSSGNTAGYATMNAEEYYRPK
jgi:hypothetical protein